MTILSTSSSATSPTATEGDVKTYLANLREFMADLLGTDSANKYAVSVALGSLLNSTSEKTGSYTVLQSDRGKVIRCTGSWSMAITAAATLGDGFSFSVWNSGAGTITIDPNLSETIDGATTKAIGPGKFAIVFCNGSSFGTIGIGFSLSDLLSVDGAGSGLDADLLDGYHYNNLPYAGINKNFDWELCVSSFAAGSQVNLFSSYGAGVFFIKTSGGITHIVNVVGGALPDSLVYLVQPTLDYPGISTTWSTNSRIQNNLSDTCSIYKLRKLA